MIILYQTSSEFYKHSLHWLSGHALLLSPCVPSLQPLQHDELYCGLQKKTTTVNRQTQYISVCPSFYSVKMDKTIFFLMHSWQRCTNSNIKDNSLPEILAMNYKYNSGNEL